MKEFIVVIDEGTTGVRGFVYNKKMQIVGEAYKKLEVVFPEPYAVECDAMEIYEKSLEVCREALIKANILPEEVAAFGITNQRTTWVIWDKTTGKPLRNAVTWLDNRGILQREKWAKDPVFSGQYPGLAENLPGEFMPLILDKIKYDEPEFREEFEKGNCLYGSIDTWLIWKLTGGKTFAVSGSTACMSTIYLTEFKSWNFPILDYVGVTASMLPEIKEESDDYGVVDESIFGVEIPIYGVVADQQAALFSHGCLEKNTAKCTNGTGSFVDINVGNEYKTAEGLLPGIAWTLNGETTYLLEGFSSTAGACLEWAKNNLKLFTDFDVMDERAKEVKDSGGCYFVPALSGLHGAPILDETSKGAFMGITGATTRNHMIRAMLESLGFAVSSLMIKAKEQGVAIKKIKISGNVSKSNIVGQTIANVVVAEVIRPNSVEATALGAAELTGLKLGWISLCDIEGFLNAEKVFTYDEQCDEYRKFFDSWVDVCKRTQNWHN